MENLIYRFNSSGIDSDGQNKYGDVSTSKIELECKDFRYNQFGFLKSSYKWSFVGTDKNHKEFNTFKADDFRYDINGFDEQGFNSTGTNFYGRDAKGTLRGTDYSKSKNSGITIGNYE